MLGRGLRRIPASILVPRRWGVEPVLSLRTGQTSGRAVAIGVIIAVSGYGKEDSLKRSREAGCDDYAVKPIDLDKLTALMRRTRRGE